METESIWIVDDEADLASAYAEFLGGSYQTKVYNSAALALAAYEAGPERPRLIVTDIKMPEIDGVSFLARVRNHNAEQPIILISGQAEKHHLLRATSLGISRFVEKPCDPNQLKAAIDETVGTLEQKKITDELLRLLKRQVECQKTLIDLQFERLGKAENTLASSGISWSLPKDGQTVMSKALKLEHELHAEIERLRERIKLKFAKKAEAPTKPKA